VNNERVASTVEVADRQLKVMVPGAETVWTRSMDYVWQEAVNDAESGLAKTTGGV